MYGEYGIFISDSKVYGKNHRNTSDVVSVGCVLCLEILPYNK